MAYITRHKLANGDVEVTRRHAGEVDTFIQSEEDADYVSTSKVKPKKEVGYNFHPTRSKQIREKELGAHLNELRKDYTHTKGFSDKKTRKHVASIPPEIWWSERAERGYDGMRGKKNIKAICDKWNLNVSHW